MEASIVLVGWQNAGCGTESDQSNKMTIEPVELVWPATICKKSRNINCKKLLTEGMVLFICIHDIIISSARLPEQDDLSIS